MKKKYETKKPPNLSKCTLQICDKPSKILISESSSMIESKHEMFASTKDDKVSNNLLDSNGKFYS